MTVPFFARSALSMDSDFRRNDVVTQITPRTDELRELAPLFAGAE